jgi:hypothetical protein
VRNSDEPERRPEADSATVVSEALASRPRNRGILFGAEEAMARFGRRDMRENEEAE